MPFQQRVHLSKRRWSGKLCSQLWILPQISLLTITPLLCQPRSDRMANQTSEDVRFSLTQPVELVGYVLRVKAQRPGFRDVERKVLEHDLLARIGQASMRLPRVPSDGHVSLYDFSLINMGKYRLTSQDFGIDVLNSRGKPDDALFRSLLRRPAPPTCRSTYVEVGFPPLMWLRDTLATLPEANSVGYLNQSAEFIGNGPELSIFYGLATEYIRKYPDKAEQIIAIAVRATRSAQPIRIGTSLLDRQFGFYRAARDLMSEAHVRKARIDLLAAAIRAFIEETARGPICADSTEDTARRSLVAGFNRQRFGSEIPFDPEEYDKWASSRLRERAIPPALEMPPFLNKSAFGVLKQLELTSSYPTFVNGFHGLIQQWHDWQKPEGLDDETFFDAKASFADGVFRTVTDPAMRGEAADRCWQFLANHPAKSYNFAFWLTHALSILELVAESRDSLDPATRAKFLHSSDPVLDFIATFELQAKTVRTQ